MFARFMRTLEISVAPRDNGHHRGCGMQYQLYPQVISKHNDTRQLEKETRLNYWNEHASVMH
jgi:hypothetical protein